MQPSQAQPAPDLPRAFKVGSTALATLAFALAVLLAPQAQAAELEHPFLENFGSAAEPTFSSPAGMAVDQSTADLLVIDAAAKTVSRFHADGTPSNFAELGGNVIDGNAGGADATPSGEILGGGANEVQVAVDNSGTATDGDIYVTDVGHHVIDIFNSEGKYLEQLSAAGVTAFGETCGVAVDEGGNVYVGDYGGGVHKFEPTANPAVNGDHVATFTTVANPCTLAAGGGPSAGSLFVDNYGGTLFKLDSSSGAEKYEISSGNTTVSVDPGTGHVYAAAGTKVDEYHAGASAATLVSTTEPGGAVTGVAADEAAGNLYAARSGASQVEVFGPLNFGPPPPTATTGAATPTSPTTADLNGSVNPNGSATSDCHFEWGPALGDYSTGSAPCSPDPGSASANTAVTGDATGLTTGATYHYRVVLTAGATTANGDDASFIASLPPSVSNDAVGAVDRHTAVLNGHIDNNSDPSGSSCAFQVTTSADTSFSSPSALTVSCDSPYDPPNKIAGSGSTAVTATATGLDLNTAYIYRVVATNAGGTTNGSPAQAFTTVPDPPIVSTDPEGAVAKTTAVLNGHVDANAPSAACSFQVTTPSDPTFSSPLAPVTCSPATVLAADGNKAVTATAAGLTPNTDYIYRVVATNAGGTTNGAPPEPFTTVANSPTVATLANGALTQTTAVLNATVDNRGAPAGSFCAFDVTPATDPDGYSSPDSTTVACSTAPITTADGVATPVSATATGLEPNTAYVFRVFARNAGGGPIFGADQPFTTPPSPPGISAEAATGITQTKATLGAMVDPNESQVSSCQFEWGPSDQYGTTVPCSEDPGSGPDPVSVSIPQLTGLSPNTTYHFRLVATNAGGTANGADHSFTTLTDTCAANAALCPPPTLTPSTTIPAPTTPRVVRCRAGFVKRHGKCVRKHPRKKHHKRARRGHGGNR